MEDLEALEKDSYILFKQEKVGEEDQRNFEELEWSEDNLKPIPQAVSEELARLLFVEDDIEVFENKGRILITSEGVFVILHIDDTHYINATN